MLISSQGGNSGIGFETVAALLKASANYHVIMAARSIEKAQKAVDEIKSLHGDALKGEVSLVRIDVTDIESVRAAQQDVESRFGRVDVLINNAGIIVTRECDTLTNLRETFETNAFGPAIVTEIFEPLLKKSSRPKIIYVSSGQGSMTLKLDPANPHRLIRGDFYRMSKSALNMLATSHRVHFADWGCRVTAFDPGFCVSNLTGPEGRKMRIKNGARDPAEPARELVRIIEGKRDADWDKCGMMDVDGGISPW